MEQAKIYQTLRILNAFFTSAFGGILFPGTKLVFGAYVVINTFGCITLIHSGNIFMGLVMLLCAVFMFGVKASIYPNAAKILNLASEFTCSRSRKNKQVMKRAFLAPTTVASSKYELAVFKSQIPIAVHIGSFYGVDRKTLLIYLDTIVSYTIGLLIG